MVISELELLPEEVHWRDEGCEFYPSCLNCPLERCIEEEPGGRRRLKKIARIRRIDNLKNSGRSVVEIARIIGVSTRTVQRALADSRDGEKGHHE